MRWRKPAWFLTELPNSGSKRKLASDEVAEILWRHSSESRNPETLCQRCEILNKVRDVFGASASNSLPGGYRALVPPDPIPNSAVKRRIADGSVGVPMRE